MKQFKVYAAALLALAAFVQSSAVMASDVEQWTWVEYRQPINIGDNTVFPRVAQARFFTDFRLADRLHGLHFSFFRVGPIVDVTPWLKVPVHFVLASERASSDRFLTEYRAELEPTLHGRLGDFTLSDRNRFERRWRENSADLYRYRNLIRVNYQPVGAKFIPFVFNEFLIDLSGSGYNQNRLSGGAGYMLSDNVRFDLGLMARQRKVGTDWVNDNVLLTYLFIGLPVVK